MRNWTVRERAGMAVIASAAAVASLGFWTHGQTAADEGLAPLTPPAMGVEVPARGGDGGPGSGVTITEPGNRASEMPPTTLVVHVLGAVRRPGVYTLKEGDRVVNAVQAADGFKSNAAEETLNLAERLRDGDQVYVAARGASAPPVPALPTVRHAEVSTPSTSSRSRRSATQPKSGRVLGAPPTSSSTSLPPVAASESKPAAAPEKAGKLRIPGDGTVNLNTADLEELQRLPGIGPAMAARIVSYRGEIGSFNAPEQLMDVRGIGEKKYAAMEPFLRVK